MPLYLSTEKTHRQSNLPHSKPVCASLGSVLVVLAIVPDRPLLRKAARPLATFLAVALTGVLGFLVLTDASVVQATFWLVDPTSLELYGVDDRTRAFALVIFVGLVVSGLWIGETVLGAAFGGQIQEELKQAYMERRIDDLTDHVVVCGYGIFGRTIANTLKNAGRDVVAIEKDRQQVESIDSERLFAMHADATTEEGLLAAGIERADVVVAAVDDSNTNVQIAILASQLAPDVRVVVRVGDETYSTLARRAGADQVIIPEITSGQQVSQALSAEMRSEE